MSYSKDVRRLVRRFVDSGGSKEEAALRFGISRSTVFRWMSQPADYQLGKPGPKSSRKFDEEMLRLDVEKNPDILLRELAEPRGVSINTISVALRRMGIVRRKIMRPRPAAQ